MPEVPKEEEQLSHADCICSVCLEIFLEPVTLPCGHTFCKTCFQQTVYKASMCCPLCRKRVSTWCRLHSRNKTLVNAELWRKVQAAFPLQCQRKLSGQDADDSCTLVPLRTISKPGELREEYEAQLSKLAEEKRALEEAERQASEEYIRRLLAEEEERQAEERRREEEQQLEHDEMLARLLSQELNSSQVFQPQGNRTQVASQVQHPLVKKKRKSGGDIEKYLSPISHRSSTCHVHPETGQSAGLSANKENISFSGPVFNEQGIPKLSPQAKSRFSERTCGELVEEPSMPELTFCGKMDCCRDLSETPIKSEDMQCRDTEWGPEQSTYVFNNGGCSTDLRSSFESMGTAERDGELSADTRQGPHTKTDVRKRKSKECRQEIDSELASKRLKAVAIDFESGGVSDFPVDVSGIQEQMKLEEQMLKRQQQEEEDRLLALKLQKQLDQESKAVNRKKGSPDEYPFREKLRQPHGSGSGDSAAGSSQGLSSGTRRSRSCPSAQQKEADTVMEKSRHSDCDSLRDAAGKTNSAMTATPTTSSKYTRRQMTLLNMFQSQSR
ncbi:E3 ubiquitin-protein ligase rnf168 [Lepisosteus oculatus]|uniref:E3 ubiquitin-protein ligase rnf168 n=1 Tax=Lepisosteus oculatus TaxID=7918 RepID=UPI0035F5218A